MDTDMIDVSVTFGTEKNPIYIPFCLYNASGPRSGTVEALRTIATSQSGAVLTKSATLLPQPDGNPLPRTHHTADQMASFNSEGLPNRGIDYYISNEARHEVLCRTTATDPIETSSSSSSSFYIEKPYIVSLSGKTLSDNIDMIRRIVAMNNNSVDEKNDTVADTSTTPTPLLIQPPKIASIELNLACPNIIGKPIIGYDMNQLEETLRQLSVVVKELRHSDGDDVVPPLGIKLPPYFDMIHFQTVATIINTYSSIVSYVVTMNTIGNALCIDGQYMGTPYISANQGYAGLSGPCIHYTALANVRQLRQLLQPSIQVIGVGGIRTGQDLYNMILCGATACQIATTHWKEGSTCFDRIYTEFIAIMKHHKYHAVQEIFNQLQPYSKERATIGRQLQQQEKERQKQSTSTVSASSSHQTNDHDVMFYKTLSIVLTLVLAIVLSYELKKQV